MSDFPEYRLQKLEQLQASETKVWPERFEITHTLAASTNLPDNTAGVRVAGRVVAIRKLGKLTFAHLQDMEGRLQFALKKDMLGERYDLFHQTVDIGDFIGVNGTTFTTKTGEKTVMAEGYTYLGKALRELPEKWHGLSDVELRYRQRYLDLITNDASRRVFLLRTKTIKALRNFLDNRGFMEVETPILTNQASGALAKPFITHHNALDIDTYLRIAPETYLKRCIVGGFTHVYEVSRCFRNEGISPVHLQDFTMVEGYSAYWNYQDNMRLMRELILHILGEVFDSFEIKVGEHQIDFSQPWPAISFREMIIKDAGIDIDEHADGPSLLQAIRQRGISLEHENLQALGKGNLIDVLYKKVSRPQMIQPVFLTEHPIELSPLARRNDHNPQVADRFQLVVNGAELINAYSELVDPIDQRTRLEQQSQLRSQGDEEAMPLDTDYLKAMEHGMPPISGWGMGIDRLLQVLLDLPNIRDSVLYPLMRPLGE